MPTGWDYFGGYTGGPRGPGKRHPKPKSYKGSKAAKKASRRRR